MSSYNLAFPSPISPPPPPPIVPTPIPHSHRSKGRLCCLGTGHLAAWVIWRKLAGKTSILGGWWFRVVWTRWSSIVHFFWSIYSAKRPSFYSSFFPHHPGAKSAVQHGIERIPSTKQQRRPLLSLLSVYSLIYSSLVLIQIQPPARLPVGLTCSADSLEQLRSRSSVERLSSDRLDSSLARLSVTWPNAVLSVPPHSTAVLLSATWATAVLSATWATAGESLTADLSASLIPGLTASGAAGCWLSWAAGTCKSNFLTDHRRMNFCSSIKNWRIPLFS